jgi:hypothetical protein
LALILCLCVFLSVFLCLCVCTCACVCVDKRRRWLLRVEREVFLVDAVGCMKSDCDDVLGRCSRVFEE